MNTQKGYGYNHPTDDYSRLFTIFFILVGVYVIFSGIYDVFHSNAVMIRRYLCPRSEPQIMRGIALGDVFHFRRMLGFYLIAFFVWIVIGATILRSYENWTWITAFYFVVATSSVSAFIFVKDINVLTCKKCNALLINVL